MRLAALALVLASFTGCKKEHCISSQTDYVSGGVRVEWSHCPDDHNHIVDCAMRGTDFTCNCNPGESFDLPLPKDGTTKDLMTPEKAREGCKWDFTP